MSLPKRILITPGEPAGIGPDITLDISKKAHAAELIVIADKVVLSERAEALGLPIKLIECDLNAPPTSHEANTLKILPIKTKEPVTPGQLNSQNASYVIDTLKKAASLCESGFAQALVTGPIQKAIINQAGIPFTGHTEFFAHHANVNQTVMMFVVNSLKVAIATTHLPLIDVSKKLTKDHLRTVISVLNDGLKQQFKLKTPRILVCGLNPHAGESGYLGREEIEIITPVLDELRHEGFHLIGPLSADTIFTPKCLQEGDAVLAMYHDQALPLVKYVGFGNAVNVTLGLPYIRTSVDHGTALDLAATGKADAGSLAQAIALAELL